MRKKSSHNNKGFSMVELIIAFGIMGVIVTTVGYMMTTSSKTYNSLSTEAQLQSEAQLVANAISELAIDSFDAGNTMETDLSSKIDPAVTDKLVLLSKTRSSACRYYFVLDKGKKELNLYTQEYDQKKDQYKVASGPSLVGQYIDGFVVNLDRVKDENIISFRLNYVKNGRKYQGDYQVLMRNRAYADPDAKPDEPDTPQLRGMTLTPKLVYIDVKNGEPVTAHIDSVNAVDTKLSEITFKATPLYNGTAASLDSTWKLAQADTDLFSMSNDKGTTSKLVCETGMQQKYKETAKTDFSVVAIHETLSKEARIRLRIVRKILWSANTGISSWKTSYTSYGATELPDANGYAAAGTTVVLMPFVDQSNVSTDLKWELYKRGSNGQWSECTDSNQAQMTSGDKEKDSNIRVTKGGRQSMAIKIGKNVTNDISFRVVVTSVFDPSVSAEYIFGIAPEKPTEPGGGYYSRGYKINLEKVLTDPDEDKTIQGHKVKRITKVSFAGGDMMDDGNNDARLHWDGNTFYLDMNCFNYSNISQRVEFFKRRTLYINIEFVYVDENGNEQPGRLDHYQYYIEPVKVKPTSTGSPIICLQKGKTASYETQIGNYNLTKRKEFGIYVAEGTGEYSNNVNLAGHESTNTYLTINDKTSYGTSDTYKDIASFDVQAKTSTKFYPTDYLRLRVTVEDYFNITNPRGSEADSYCDNYKIYIANVDGQNVYLPGPNAIKVADATQSIGWPNDTIPTGKENAVSITGISTSGTSVSAKVYKEGSKYKCIYGANVYTYNNTYEYWKK